MEHTLPGKDPSDRETINPSDQSSIGIPGFDGMGQTEVIELTKELLDIARNPGFMTIRTRLDHGTKGNIGAEAELVLASGTPQRTGNPVAIPGDKSSLGGSNPEDLTFAVIGHRETAFHVGTKHPSRADRNPIFVSDSLNRAQVILQWKSL